VYGGAVEKSLISVCFSCASTVTSAGCRHGECGGVATSVRFDEVGWRLDGGGGAIDFGGEVETAAVTSWLSRVLSGCVACDDAGSASGSGAASLQDWVEAWDSEVGGSGCVSNWDDAASAISLSRRSSAGVGLGKLSFTIC
jgi:hypothetical protein